MPANHFGLQVRAILRRRAERTARSLADALAPRAPQRTLPALTDLGTAVRESPRYRVSEDEVSFRTRALAVYCKAGEVPTALAHLRDKYASNIAAVVLHADGDAALLAPLDGGIEVLSIEELKSRADLTLVVFGNQPDRKLVRLAIAGVRNAIFAQDPRYAPSSRFDPRFLEKNRAALEELFEQLVDDESRRVLASIIRMRTTGDYGYIRIADYPEYDHPIVRPAHADVVFDLGMETAHTSLWFSERTGAAGRVFGFEASPEHWEPIETALAAAGVTNVRMVKSGVWNKKGELDFVGGMRGASRVSRASDPRATIKVPVVDLDSFVEQEKLDRVSMLSFDIEGAEPEALQGATKTIQKFRPKLQVSIYHRPDHLFKLPQQIARMGVPYRFYLGHHSAQGLETDLYAEPV